LRSQGAVELGIIPPGTCDVLEITLPATRSAYTGSPSQRFKGYFIQALALFLCAPPESSVHRSRYFPNCVLHAFNVGYAGM
jgi:hypothetical protein